MARRRTYRKRIRRTRWASNLQDIAPTTETATAGDFANVIGLTTNPTQSVLSVSQIYTVKNFSIDFTLEAFGEGAAFLEAMTAYIMYLPQGMTAGSDYHIQHPEYIMAYKYLGSPNPAASSSAQASIEQQQFQPTRIRSRLSRKLNTGDSIILYIKGYNQNTTGSYTYQLSGIVRWFTKAN